MRQSALAGVKSCRIYIREVKKRCHRRGTSSGRRTVKQQKHNIDFFLLVREKRINKQQKQHMEAAQLLLK
jgi:hypothetical protein